MPWKPSLKVLKEFHETPEVKAILASVNFTEHQRRNVLDKNSFTKSQRGNRFWPASVSRNNKEINVLDDDSLRNPRGENGFDSFMKSPRGIRFWPMFGENTNNNDPTHKKVKNEKTFLKCVGTCFSSRFYTPLSVFEYFVLFYFWCEGGVSIFCRSFLLSVLVKGEPFGFSRFWWEEEILTLVADQGHSFSPLLFVYTLTGTWGPARVFSPHLRILKNGWFQTTKWPLCAVLRWEGVVLPGLRAKGDPLGKIHGYSGGTTIRPIDFTHGPHRASSLYV